MKAFLVHLSKSSHPVAGKESFSETANSINASNRRKLFQPNTDRTLLDITDITVCVYKIKANFTI